MIMRDRITDDMKAAMKSGDKVRRDTLRMVIAAFKNKAVEPGRESPELSEDEVMAVLAYSVKTRKDSASQYDDAKRPELADIERAEIAVIEGYLPQQMDEDATKAAVEAAIAETGAASKADLGKVMKFVMAAHKGTVDGKLVSRFAGQLLG
ncbi:MAG: hypothetical protein ACI8QC_001715 [Planctomycetota bacterium]|jgi:uncharacterized protein YqeY